MPHRPIRERVEEREESLSSFAAKSRLSRGRATPEEPDPIRTCFQRDRDRIIHSKAFRRLKHKTQVFIAPVGDHYVTRLTHTLEVCQIARTIARALSLNEDLVEAIALGHDLGHPPFGHVGEEVLDGIYPGGFRHSSQSLRVVEVLEKEGQGLNLTWEVRQGIAAHSKPREGLSPDLAPHDITLEAQVCRIADAVAYVNHDIGDAIRAGLLSEEALPQEVKDVLGTRHSQRINTMVTNIVESSWAATGEVPLPLGSRPVIQMSPRVLAAANALREFLFGRVYIPVGQGEEARQAMEAVRFLYEHYCTHPEEIPPDYALRGEPPERMALDYLSGMTDRFALKTAEALGRPLR